MITDLVHSLTGMGTTAMAWVTARASTVAQNVNFIVMLCWVKYVLCSWIKKVKKKEGRVGSRERRGEGGVGEKRRKENEGKKG